MHKLSDNFNFFLSTMAGYTAFSILCFIPEAYGISLFFDWILSERVEALGLQVQTTVNGINLNMAFGMGFAFFVFAAIYFNALNGHKAMANFVTICAVALAVISYSNMLIVLWGGSIFWFALLGALIVSVLPALLLDYTVGIMSKRANTHRHLWERALNEQAKAYAMQRIAKIKAKSMEAREDLYEDYEQNVIDQIEKEMNNG